MWGRNDGKTAADILQNQFTRYLVTAVKRQKVSYIRSKRQMAGREVSLEIKENERFFYAETDMLGALPLTEQLEDQGLRIALKEMRERERYILLEHVLAGRSFAELSAGLGISYKGIAAVYYRAVKKIRERMKEAERNGF